MSDASREIAQAQAKLARLQALRAAVDAFNDLDFALLFGLPLHQRQRAVTRLRLAIEGQARHIDWLKESRPLTLPRNVSVAWQRDIEAWRAQGGNCD